MYYNNNTYTYIREKLQNNMQKFEKEHQERRQEAELIHLFVHCLIISCVSYFVYIQRIINSCFTETYAQ